MPKRMLIDATHPEETRVSVVDGRRLEEFDVEVASRKQLKGNIYLAKITRVEPSLQAAFVEYGGNRHGFLAFSEIHPDYYRIPVEDREALLAEQAALAREQDQDGEPESDRERQPHAEPQPDAAEEPSSEHGLPGGESAAESASQEEQEEEVELQKLADDGGQAVALRMTAEPDLSLRGDILEPEEVQHGGPAEDSPDSLTAEEPVAMAPSESAEPADAEEPVAEGGPPEEPTLAPAAGDEAPEHRAVIEQAPPVPQALETVGGDEAEEPSPRRQRTLSRRYKIQDVIKRRQILLVQVTKEERGNKGAALTTYLSLAGRYCVLMPNTDRGGGVSRKITNVGDRKRLKSIIEDLELPAGMAVIVRTAGSDRSKPEVKRDFEYLLRLWDEIRELTLHSTAPALIYEEANLIKRAIRDLYTRDIEDIQVEGDEAYKAAKSFMRMLTPSHAKRVQQYKDPTMPLFTRYQIESQLDAIHNPTVQLKSGGYIVINQTEALVAIDVNSGRATRERNIEETALKTNMEAAEEIARQLRLRDLAGLIVIDFIDMDESRHNGQVERKLKEALRHDRARIQLGRISPFGLLEMSRQRLRPSLVEASTEICRHCHGTGRVRSTESTALHVLRSIEEEGAKQKSAAMTVFVPPPVALFILNQKRQSLAELELRQGFRIYVSADEALVPPEFRIERMKTLAPGDAPPAPVVQPSQPAVEVEAEPEIEAEEEEAEAVEATPAERAPEPRNERPENGGERRRGRRRRRRGRERHGGDEHRGSEDRRAGDMLREAPRQHRPDEEMPAPAQVREGSAEEATETSESSAGRPAGEGPGNAVDGDPTRRRRRRGRRGGRRRRRGGEQGPQDNRGFEPGGIASGETEVEVGSEPDASPPQSDFVPIEAPQPPPEARLPEARPKEIEPPAGESVRRPEPAAHQPEPVQAPAPVAVEGERESVEPAQRKRGWWQRMLPS
ncbi:MAG TPA: Rne/Rng family ribonuclease [Candidatus Udaeobacter sp.]|nr:Rne/Rng family ribonuclease [Candidatus Udaeobacter sp.]